MPKKSLSKEQKLLFEREIAEAIEKNVPYLALEFSLDFPRINPVELTANSLEKAIQMAKARFNGRGKFNVAILSTALPVPDEIEYYKL